MAEVLGWTARLHPQFRFAAAKTLSDVVVQAWRELPAEADRSFDGGATSWTKRAFDFTRATKDKLEASVGVKPQQATYLQYQVEGGRRSPRNVALRLPSVVQLDAQGNMPPGLVRQLIARAKAGKRATRAQSRRFKVSQELDLFYGEPGDGRPAGIYQRVVHSATKHVLVPIVVFPRRQAVYTERRLDFYAFADRIVRRNFEPTLLRNWHAAVASMR